MSLVDESRTEKRKCDMCGAEHVSTMNYDAESTADMKRDGARHPIHPIYSRLDYPWRTVEVREASGFAAKNIECCNAKCVAAALVEAMGDGARVKRVVIDLESGLKP